MVATAIMQTRRWFRVCEGPIPQKILPEVHSDGYILISSADAAIYIWIPLFDVNAVPSSTVWAITERSSKRDTIPLRGSC